MEKYSKQTKDFIEAVSGKKSDEAPEDKTILPSIVRAAKLLTKPKNIPNAIIAYGLTKESSFKLEEDISILELRDILMKNFGSEWIDWAPETIKKTLLDGKDNEILENKVQALALCLSTDTPWQEWHIFENVGKAFNHQVPNFGLLQPLSAGECAVTMQLMKDLREPDEEFSREVLIYVAACAYEDNLVYLPSEYEIGLAQPTLDQFTVGQEELKKETHGMWVRLREKENLMDLEINEEIPLEVQLGKLAILREYIKENV